MSSSQDYLSSQEFAQKAGVSASTVSKWLRKNKINGIKEGRKWMIPPAELEKVTTARGQGQGKPPKTQSPAQKTAPAPRIETKAYTIQEFSQITYLTEYGVEKWLREGRLVSAVDESGKALVASSNLDRRSIKRLLR